MPNILTATRALLIAVAVLIAAIAVTTAIGADAVTTATWWDATHGTGDSWWDF